MSNTAISHREYAGKTDEELADSCKRKDELAMEELMARYMRQIFAFARQYVKTNEDAEDIAQDTFYKVWKYINHFSAGRQFRPWLYTIARNTALDHIKKKKAVVFSELDDETNDLQFADTVEDTEPLQDEAYESKTMAKKLSSALTSLHPMHREILSMHYRDEMTFHEIAKILKKPMNTVKSWHRRALFRLKTLLSHHAEE